MTWLSDIKSFIKRTDKTKDTPKAAMTKVSSAEILRIFKCVHIFRLLLQQRQTTIMVINRDKNREK